MRRPTALGLAALGALGVLLVALPSRSAPKTLDIVDLADGTQIVGIVAKEEPGKYVAIVTAAGEQHTIPWARLKPAPAPAASPSTTVIAPPAAPPSPPPSATAAAPAAPPPPPPPAPKHGVVLLKDKKRLEGEIIRQEPGQFVVIDLPDGSEKTIPWDRIAEVEVTAAKPPAPTK